MQKKPSESVEIGRLSALSEEGSFELSDWDSPRVNQLLIQWTVILAVGEHNREIEVPDTLKHYTEETDQGVEGNFLKLELKAVTQLMKENSAIDSQNIKNVRFCDESGIWKPFPDKFYISQDKAVVKDATANHFSKIRIQMEGFKPRGALDIFKRRVTLNFIENHTTPRESVLTNPRSPLM